MAATDAGGSGQRPADVTLRELLTGSLLPTLRTFLRGAALATGSGLLVGSVVTAALVRLGYPLLDSLAVGGVGWYFGALLVPTGMCLLALYTHASSLYEWLDTVFESRKETVVWFVGITGLVGGYCWLLWRYVGPDPANWPVIVLTVVLVQPVTVGLGVLLSHRLMSPDIHRLIDVSLPARTTVVVIPNVDRINGFAVSAFGLWDAVILTEGAVTELSPAGLNALVGHELGHLARKDTVVLNLAVIAALAVLGGVFYWSPMGPRAVATYVLTGMTAIGLVVGGGYVTARWSRWREYAADEYGARVTSPVGMLDLLETLQEHHERVERSPWGRLVRRHPVLDDRIDRIEALQDGGE